MTAGRCANSQRETERSTMSRLDDWMTALGAELGVDAGDDSVRTILNMARVVAHQVDRPAAPVTAYLLGIAVGRGQSLADAAATANRLADGWPAPEEGDN
jgi:hypothetical protein